MPFASQSRRKSWPAIATDGKFTKRTRGWFEQAEREAPVPDARRMMAANVRNGRKADTCLTHECRVSFEGKRPVTAKRAQQQRQQHGASEQRKTGVGIEP